MTAHFSRGNLPERMKYIPALSASVALALVGCESMNAPLTQSGSFDPLAPAGGRTRTETSAGASFKPGQFVRAIIDNTAFFSKRPKGDADADKLLPRETQMKVISADASYVKVELDSGEVGFVPSVMVHDPNAPIAGVAGDPSNGVIYPPLPAGGSVEPLPNLTPTDVPPGGVPPIIPLDPSAPVPSAPVAAGDPSTAPAAAPAAPATPAPAPAPTTPPPLPPNGEGN